MRATTSVSVDGFRRRRSGSCSGGDGVPRGRLQADSAGDVAARLRIGLAATGDSTPRRRPHRTSASRSKRGPVGALETARFTPTVHEMTILRVRLFGFRFTDVCINIDEDSVRRAHGPKRGRSRFPGTDSMQVMGSVRVPTWTAIGDWQPTGGDAAPGRLGARHRAVNRRENQ